MLDLVQHINRDKFEPIVLCSPGGELPDMLRQRAVRVCTVGTGEFLRFSGSQPIGTIRDLLAVTKEILRLAREESVQVVHAFDGMLFFAASLARLLRPDLKVIWLDSGFNLYPYHFRLLMKWCFKRAALVAAVTDIRRKQLLTEGLSAEKSAVFPCGTDFHLRPPTPARLSADDADGTFHIGIVARIVPIKNFELFLQAARLVADKHAAARFHIVGGQGFLESDLEYYRRIQTLVRELRLTERLRFHEPVEDLSPLLSGFDLLVSSSHIETFGRTLVEAMALSKPVVATAVGGVPEVIADGEVGYLVPPGDTAAMAEKISRLITNADLRETIGQRGRQRVLKRFDVYAITRRWERTYETLLQDAAEPNPLQVWLSE